MSNARASQRRTRSQTNGQVVRKKAKLIRVRMVVDVLVDDGTEDLETVSITDDNGQFIVVKPSQLAGFAGLVQKLIAETNERLNAQEKGSETT